MRSRISRQRGKRCGDECRDDRESGKVQVQRGEAQTGRG